MMKKILSLVLAFGFAGICFGAGDTPINNLRLTSDANAGGHSITNLVTGSGTNSAATVGYVQTTSGYVGYTNLNNQITAETNRAIQAEVGLWVSTTGLVTTATNTLWQNTTNLVTTSTNELWSATTNRLVVIEGRTSTWNQASVDGISATGRLVVVEGRTSTWNQAVIDSTNAWVGRVSGLEGRTTVWNQAAIDSTNAWVSRVSGIEGRTSTWNQASVDGISATGRLVVVEGRTNFWNAAVTNVNGYSGPSVTLGYIDVGADPAGAAGLVAGDLTIHTNRQDNPHFVTASQIGALTNGSFTITNTIDRAGVISGNGTNWGIGTQSLFRVGVNSTSWNPVYQLTLLTNGTGISIDTSVAANHLSMTLGLTNASGAPFATTGALALATDVLWQNTTNLVTVATNTYDLVLNRYVDSSWVISSPYPDNQGVYNNSAASLSNYMYSIGGSFEAVTAITNVYRFDGTGGVGINVAGLPAARQYPAAVSYSGCVYSVAGLDAGLVPTSDLYKFNGTSWSTDVSLPLISGFGRYDVAAAVLGENMYVLGGFIGPAMNVGMTIDNVTKFDGASWLDVAVLPSARQGGCAVTLGNKLYYIGGTSVNSDPTSGKSNVYCFDGSSWAETNSMPTAKTWGAAVSLGSYIYVFGGYDVAGALSTATYRFDGTNWSTVASWSVATEGFGGAVLNGSVYAIGGANGPQFPTNIWKFIPESYDNVAHLSDLDLLPSYVLTNHNATAVALGTNLTVAGSMTASNHVYFGERGDLWSDTDQNYVSMGISGQNNFLASPNGGWVVVSSSSQYLFLMGAAYDIGVGSCLKIGSAGIERMRVSHLGGVSIGSTGLSDTLTDGSLAVASNLNVQGSVSIRGLPGVAGASGTLYTNAAGQLFVSP